MRESENDDELAKIVCLGCLRQELLDLAGMGMDFSRTDRAPRGPPCQDMSRHVRKMLRYPLDP